MPSSAPPPSRHQCRGGEDIAGRLSSTSPREVKLKALRELKNKIIGNRTKKQSFLDLGIVPLVVSILRDASAAGIGDELDDSLIIQSAAVVGSFACGFDAGVNAVLDAGAYAPLFSLVSHHSEKIVDAGARALKFIYQSKFAPKYDFFIDKNMDFLHSLLNSENENVTGLGASIISHSCQTRVEQNALTSAGLLKKLISLIRISLIHRDASLESLAAVLKENPEVISRFVELEGRGALNVVTELAKDKYSRTRLLACMCLIVIKNADSSFLQDVQTKIKLISTLLELLDDSSPVGDESPFALSSLVADKEDIQMLAFEAKVVDKLCNHLQKGSLSPRKLLGIFVALADLCSTLECCRERLLELESLKNVTDALTHECTEVRAAACICLKNVSRSIKNLSAGHFMNETVIVPLLQLLYDSSTSVQVAALGVIGNIVVDFTESKLVFTQCGGAKHLVELSKSMDPIIRAKAVLALRNLTFLVNERCKEEILLELTQSALTSLICDPETCVQEQAFALVRNLVDGPIGSIEYLLGEDGVLLRTIGRQLEIATKSEVLVQVAYILCNVASGNELHKEGVMHFLFPSVGNDTQSVLVKLLTSNDICVHTAAVWVLVNLTCPSSPGASSRVAKLRNAGVLSLLKNMTRDSSLDVKLRARIALRQLSALDDVSL